ncbi:MAG: VWA domain-containing protein [Candidatus Riflebacteria bacterium]|nr:VWA domain-containing protein [Candidatus Riflebacteria bacterium]
MKYSDIMISQIQLLMVMFHFCMIVLIPAASVEGSQVKVTALFGQPYMMPAPNQNNYIKVGLSGFSEKNLVGRTPVNLAIVLDKSGSMSGSKLQHAKEAAVMAIGRLTNDDILSVIAYDSEVEVLVPATKVSDREQIYTSIRQISAGSNTALFAGVSKAAGEIRKFIDRGRVNRIILLSDGIANEGPSSPEELGELGASLSREGISVTTLGLGLGYNEDLMSELARRSDGNHAFIETPTELARIFNAEFGDVMSVIAQEVKVEIEFHNCRPVRFLGREGIIDDRKAMITLNQICDKQEKYVLLEFESAGNIKAQPLFNVNVSYINSISRQTEKFSNQLQIMFSENSEIIRANENRDVMISASKLIANDSYKVATRLRDEGKIEEARKVLISNKDFLQSRAKTYSAPELEKFAEKNVNDAANITEEASWNKTRKDMRQTQHANDYQQSY